MFTAEQVQDIRAAITYYVSHNISANNPRHKEYALILDQLQENNVNEDLSGYSRCCFCQGAVCDGSYRWSDHESDIDSQVGG